VLQPIYCDKMHTNVAMSRFCVGVLYNLIVYRPILSRKVDQFYVVGRFIKVLAMKQNNWF